LGGEVAHKTTKLLNKNAENSIELSLKMAARVAIDAKVLTTVLAM